MNNKKLGFGLIFAAIGYAVYSLVNAATKLQFGQIQLTQKRIQFNGLHLTLNFPIVNNDRKTSLPFNGFKGQLLYGTSELAKITIPQTLVIQANSTVNLLVNVDINFLDLGVNLLALIRSGDWLNAAYIVGNIKSAGVLFPVRQKITF